jgi:hypothetical protein
VFSYLSAPAHCIFNLRSSQDGFGLSLHGFFVTDHRKWTEVQQGMHGETRGRLAGITGIPGT